MKILHGLDDFGWLSRACVAHELPSECTTIRSFSRLGMLFEASELERLTFGLDIFYSDIQASEQCTYLKELSLLICIYLVLSNYNITKKYLLCVSEQNRTSAQLWASLVHFKSRL